jgi:hypothetical protein
MWTTRFPVIGLALAIIRSKRGQRGKVMVVVKSAGLQEGRASINVR